MGWFSSILDRWLPLKPDTLVLGSADAWVLSGGVDPERGRDLIGLLRCAVELFGSNSVLYLEGTAMSPAVKALLPTRQIRATSLLPRASTWPRPEAFHVPLRIDVVDELAARVADQAPGALCDHLHIYRGKALLLQGFEAGWEPLLVSFSLPESRIADFCDRMGYSYERRCAI